MILRLRLTLQVSGLGVTTPDTMQAAGTPRPIHDCGSFYRESAQYPEQVKIRRLASQWFKKLYDDQEELSVMERELNDGIASLRKQDGQGPLTILEFPRMLAKKDERLFSEWMRYEDKLRAHSRSCLPDPDPWL